MEIATSVAIFTSCSLVSFIGHAFYTAFSQLPKELTDTLQEHEDQLDERPSREKQPSKASN